MSAPDGETVAKSPGKRGRSRGRIWPKLTDPYAKPRISRIERLCTEIVVGCHFGIDPAEQKASANNRKQNRHHKQHNKKCEAAIIRKVFSDFDHHVQLSYKP